MFNNSAQFVGLTPRPIKSKIFLDLYLGKFFKISFFPFWNGKFPAFSTGQVWSNCQVYKLQFIRTWMNKNRNKNTWGSNWQKNKNIEARENFTGCHKRKRVYCMLFFYFIWTPCFKHHFKIWRTQNKFRQLLHLLVSWSLIHSVTISILLKVDSRGRMTWQFLNALDLFSP